MDASGLIVSVGLTRKLVEPKMGAVMAEKALGGIKKVPTNSTCTRSDCPGQKLFAKACPVSILVVLTFDP